MQKDWDLLRVVQMTASPKKLVVVAPSFPSRSSALKKAHAAGKIPPPKNILFRRHGSSRKKAREMMNFASRTDTLSVLQQVQQDATSLWLKTLEVIGDEAKSLEENAEKRQNNIPESPKSQVNVLDLVFCVDCTASMDSYIANTQQTVQKIAQELGQTTRVAVRFALIKYRDHPPQDSTFVTEVHSFTDCLQEMQTYVDSMSAHGGGDGPESVCCAFHEVLQLGWRNQAVKIVIHIADAPPHGIMEPGDGFLDGCPLGNDPLALAHQMKQRGIVVYTVGCEPALGAFIYARDFMVAVANITGGQATTLTSAHLLSRVVLHGSEEEVGLQRLEDQVRRELAAAREECRRAGRAFTPEAAAGLVAHSLQGKGVRTKQLTTDQQIFSPLAGHFGSSMSCAAVREKLPLRPSFAGGAFFGGGVFGGGVFGAATPASRPFSSPAGGSVAVASGGFSFGATKVGVKEDVISYDQVTRLIKRMPSAKTGEII
eukprot:CAMPEP_0206381912 /NCGR_PEP_ID=MMETSP0294-20121207/12945_1 /ASSEMBLY_ACC=CAM_ASM_000327 /TAXON_ID=39354 /ORGANISM="Heterosigma akashiwo, Strain CCMP2393" /LENGTH=484 /DNA_ID=CAMNT_0053831489 /DNA_START=115 /DNA_END=1569 /DNA_ORIENTATION=-